MIRAWLEKYLLMAATSRIEIYKSSAKIKQTFYNNSALMLRKVFLVSYLQFGAHLCWVMKPWDACRGFSSAPLNRNTIGCLKVSRDVAIILRISSITTTIAPSSPEPIKSTIVVWNCGSICYTLYPNYLDFLVWYQSDYLSADSSAMLMIYCLIWLQNSEDPDTCWSCSNAYRHPKQLVHPLPSRKGHGAWHDVSVPLHRATTGR